MSDLPDYVACEDGRFVYKDSPDIEVSDADTLGAIVDALQAALGEALTMLERIPSYCSCDGCMIKDSDDRDRIAEMREKYLGVRWRR